MILSRLAWLIFFALWMGGFVFYASFVVPITKDVIGETGIITRLVTIRINAVGVITLAWWLLHWWFEYRITRLRWTAFVLILINVGLLIWLYGLHPMIDNAESDTFYLRHRIYLWVSTFQLVFSTILLWVELVRWRIWDRKTTSNGETLRATAG